MTFVLGTIQLRKKMFTEGTVWYNNLLFIFVEIKKTKSILKVGQSVHTLIFFAKIIYLLSNNLFMLSIEAVHKRRRQFGGVGSWFIRGKKLPTHEGGRQKGCQKIGKMCQHLLWMVHYGKYMKAFVTYPHGTIRKQRVDLND